MTIIVEDTLPTSSFHDSYQGIPRLFIIRIRYEAALHSHVLLLVSCYEILLLDVYEMAILFLLTSFHVFIKVPYTIIPYHTKGLALA